MSEDGIPDFDRRADVYDALRPTDDAWWERFAALVDLGDLRGRRVLDVGCGTGRLAMALHEDARAKVWGIDASEEMVRVARATVGSGVGIRRGDARELPFRDGWFDRVTMVLVVHLLDRPLAFAEARRVVSHGGRIAIGTFHPEHFGSYWLNDLFPSIRTIDERRFPTEEALRRELRAAGFQRVESRRLTSEAVIGRDDALARIRGRHISTFDLLSELELAEGTIRAERELPEVIATRLDQLVVVGHAD